MESSTDSNFALYSTLSDRDIAQREAQVKLRMEELERHKRKINLWKMEQAVLQESQQLQQLQYQAFVCYYRLVSK